MSLYTVPPFFSVVYKTNVRQHEMGEKEQDESSRMPMTVAPFCTDR
jgi:hypothetical protein